MNTFSFLQESVQKLQVSAGRAPADFDGGGRSLGTRPGPGSADGDGHGLPNRRRGRASPRAVQKPGASCAGRPGAAGGFDAASPEALAERRRQRLCTRGIYVGATWTEARSGRVWNTDLFYFDTIKSCGHTAV